MSDSTFQTTAQWTQESTSASSSSPRVPEWSLTSPQMIGTRRKSPETRERDPSIVKKAKAMPSEH